MTPKGVVCILLIYSLLWLGIFALIGLMTGAVFNRYAIIGWAAGAFTVLFLAQEE